MCRLKKISTLESQRPIKCVFTNCMSNFLYPKIVIVFVTPKFNKRLKKHPTPISSQTFRQRYRRAELSEACS